MRVAINMAGHGKNEAILDILEQVAVQGKTQEYVFFSDRAMKDVTAEVIGSKTGSIISRRWWLDVKLPAALRKFKADVLININGEASLRTKLPQLLYVGNIAFITHPREYTSAELLFLKFYFPRYLSAAKAIITPSHAIKNAIAEKFPVKEEKIHVIHSSVGNGYLPLQWEAREQVKDGYAEGREYFLFTGGFEPKNELITVLKAFSQFKRWQRSNMKLIVTGNVSGEEMKEKLATYKFRDDVVVMDNITAEQEAKLFAAAYAFIHVPLYDASDAVVVKAMKAGTPVIAADISSVKETAGDAAVYIDAGNDEMLAAQMISLHKDEALRTNYIKRGSIQAANYPGNNAAEKLMLLIESIAAKS